MGVERRLVELGGDPAQRGTEARVRVCMLIWRLDQVGGAEVYVRQLARAMVRLGVEVVICAPFRKRAFQDDDDIPFIRLPVFDFLPRYVGGIAFLFATVLYLSRARKRYDLIHAHGLHSVAPAAIIAGSFLGKPVIAQAHGAGTTGDVSTLGRSWLRGLRRRLLMKVDRYVALTGQIRRELLEFGLDERRVLSIPNGVDLDMFRPWPGDRRALRIELGLSEKDKVVTFVGRLTPMKRVDLLVRALGRIRPSVPEARLVIVGDGPVQSAAQQLAAGLGLDDSVVFVGLKRNVVPYLQTGDLFVLPSDAEGMSIALLEAMACGVPVLVSDFEGNRELVTDSINGMLFHMGSEESLAQKMEKLLLDTTFAQALADNAAKQVQFQFGLDSVAARYLAMYEEVIDRKDVQSAAGPSCG